LNTKDSVICEFCARVMCWKFIHDGDTETVVEYCEIDDCLKLHCHPLCETAKDTGASKHSECY